jgi:hypothetical protein
MLSIYSPDHSYACQIVFSLYAIGLTLYAQIGLDPKCN